MNWSQLIEIKRYTPLREVGLEARLLRDFLYKINENSYLLAGPLNEQLERRNDERFITKVLWAQSEGAAVRAFKQEIENDRVIVGAEPPQEMLLTQGATTYGAIADTLKNAEPRTFSEFAEHRFGDLAFVHRAIMAPPFHFYFRGLKEIRDERPYAIDRYLEA